MSGGFWQGGFLSRGFLSGGFCPDTLLGILLIRVHILIMTWCLQKFNCKRILPAVLVFGI